MQKKKLVIKEPEGLLPVEIIQNKIYLIRGHKVMLDRDLAELYGVLTSQLTRQVRRNMERFPNDFLILLTRNEWSDLMCQIGTSKRGGTRKLPLAFTEQGIAMLSGVLHSARAIQVNIQIMRTFTKLREMMISHKDLARKIEDLERKFMDHDKKIILVFNAIKQLLTEKEEQSKNKGPLGFVIPKQ
jgi:ORF6N domain